MRACCAIVRVCLVDGCGGELEEWSVSGEFVG